MTYWTWCLVLDENNLQFHYSTLVVVPSLNFGVSCWTMDKLTLNSRFSFLLDYSPAHWNRVASITIQQHLREGEEYALIYCDYWLLWCDTKQRAQRMILLYISSNKCRVNKPTQVCGIQLCDLFSICSAMYFLYLSFKLNSCKNF